VVDQGRHRLQRPRALWPRTPATMAAEVDALIAALGIDGPVILSAIRSAA
jgi:hypothetical protein